MSADAVASARAAYCVTLAHGFQEAKGEGEGASSPLDTNDDEGLIRTVITHMIAFHRENPRFQRLMLHAALEGHEIAIIHHNQVKLPVGAKLIEYIERRQAAGAIRPGNPTAVLFALAGMPQFYALQKYIYQASDFPLPDDQVVDSFVRILLDGLRTSTTGEPKL